VRIRATVAVLLGLAIFLLTPWIVLGFDPFDRPLREVQATVRLVPCAMTLYDWGFDEGAGRGLSTRLDVDLKHLVTPDLKYWNTGGLAASTDYSKGLDFRRLTITSSLEGFRFDYEFSSLPKELLGTRVGVIFDLPDRRGGFSNAYTGRGFEWDLGLQARWDGPGKWTLLAGEYARERPVPGTVQEGPDRLTITVPLRTVTDLGLNKPGVMMMFGSYGPPPERIFDRVPEKGALQLGLPVEPGQAVRIRSVTQYDVNGDRTDDLFLANVTSGRVINGLGYDRNQNGQIEFSKMEGPVLFWLGPGYLDLGTPSRRTEGRRQTYLLESPVLTYGFSFEDRNGDGDTADAGETDGEVVPLNIRFWF